MKIEAFATVCLGMPVEGEVRHMFQLFAPQAVECHLPPGQTWPSALTWLAAGRVVVCSKATSVSGLVHVATAVYWYGGRATRSHPRRSDLNVPPGTEMAHVRWLTRLHVYETLRRLLGVNPSPWGVLRGVRPTKIVHRLWDKGFSPERIAAVLTSQYAVAPEKARLVTTVAARQRPYLLAPAAARRTVSVYIGIPYCPSRCVYCSFPAFPLPDTASRRAFLRALATDIQAAGEFIRARQLTVETVYIGGGTPTSLAAHELAWLLAKVRQTLPWMGVREFTVEAGRPDSLSLAKLLVLRRYGATRISINPQSMHDKTLQLIGRGHTVEDIIKVFTLARRVGFSRINMDIIAGLPGESLADFQTTLTRVAALQPDNLTVHTLARKKGAALYRAAGWLLPEAATVVDMLAAAAACAAALGMVPYYLYRQKHMIGNLENVGYARPAAVCLYNIQMMEERQTIIGIGPSAASKVVRVADWSLRSVYNPKDVATYIARLPSYINRRNAVLQQWLNNNKEV